MSVENEGRVPLVTVGEWYMRDDPEHGIVYWTRVKCGAWTEVLAISHKRLGILRPEFTEDDVRRRLDEKIDEEYVAGVRRRAGF